MTVSDCAFYTRVQINVDGATVSDDQPPWGNTLKCVHRWQVQIFLVPAMRLSAGICSDKLVLVFVVFNNWKVDISVTCLNSSHAKCRFRWIFVERQDIAKGLAGTLTLQNWTAKLTRSKISHPHFDQYRGPGGKALDKLLWTNSDTLSKILNQHRQLSIQSQAGHNCTREYRTQVRPDCKCWRNWVFQFHLRKVDYQIFRFTNYATSLLMTTIKE